MKYKDLSVTNFTCKGKCSGCGNCCGDILHLNKSEIKIIDNYVKKHKIKETKRCLLVDYDNTCPFRDNINKKCKIYEVRPEICRVYKCDKTPEEVYKNREFTNNKKLVRSMRDLFFNDRKGAEWIFKTLHIFIYDKNDKIIRGVENNDNN